MIQIVSTRAADASTSVSADCLSRLRGCVWLRELPTGAQVMGRFERTLQLPSVTRRAVEVCGRSRRLLVMVFPRDFLAGTLGTLAIKSNIANILHLSFCRIIK